MYRARSTPTTCASSGWATLASTTSAEAPGNTPETVTCGGTMSGNCATGIVSNASAPAMVMTNAITIARRGRSTKTAEIMGSCPPVWPRGPGRYRLARTHPLQALDDHLVAQREPVDHRGYCGGRLPELDPALLGLVVRADREDIIALLVGQHGGARDRQHFDRLHAFQHHSNKFAVGKLAHRTACGGRIMQRWIRDRAA